MRKVIFGVSMFFSGIISVALLFAGSMASDLLIDGRHSSFWNLSQFGLLPVLFVFAGIALIGLVIGIAGLFGREHHSSHERHSSHHEHWGEE